MKNGSMVVSSMSGGPLPPGVPPNDVMRRIMQDQQKRLQGELLLPRTFLFLLPSNHMLCSGDAQPMSSDGFREAMQDPEVQALLRVRY